MKKVNSDKLKKIKKFIRKKLKIFNNMNKRLKQQAYEIVNVRFISDKKLHEMEVKLTGKAQGSFYNAKEIAADEKFLRGFSIKDIRTVIYLATCDHLMISNKFEPMYRLFRIKNNNTQEKSIGIEHVITGGKDEKSLEEISQPEFLERLHYLDVYQLGYLLGQKQAIEDMARFKKNAFSCDPSSYTTYRPKYPKSLLVYLHTLIGSSEVVLDCGAGSGQLTEDLAGFFDRVLAVDTSQELLSKATIFPNTYYLQSFSEKLPLASHSIGLICVAQAVHWFQLDMFYNEVKRVLKPEGFIAVWCYNQAVITPKVDAVVKNIYEQVRCDENNSKERQYVYDEYKTLPFPFKKISTPSFEMTVCWDYFQWLGYMRTWPSIIEYKKQFNIDLVENSKLALRHAWGNEDKKTISWPIYLMVGQVSP